MLLASTATQESTKLSEVARQNDKVIRMYNVADGGPAHGGVQLRSQVAQDVRSQVCSRFPVYFSALSTP